MSVSAVAAVEQLTFQFPISSAPVDTSAAADLIVDLPDVVRGTAAGVRPISARNRALHERTATLFAQLEHARHKVRDLQEQIAMFDAICDSGDVTFETRRKRAKLTSQLLRVRREEDDVTYQIVELNRPLVTRQANAFAGGDREALREYEQAIDAGILRAILDYNPRRGTFAGWAHKHIARELLPVARQRLCPHLSQYAFEERPKVLAAQRHLQELSGQEPSVDAIAVEAGVSVELAAKILAPPYVSLDAPVQGDAEMPTLSDTLAADETADGQLLAAVDFAARREMVATVHAELDRLRSDCDPRGVWVLERRLLADGPAPSFAQLGKELSLSREQARQLYLNARAMLDRSPAVERMRLALLDAAA